MSAISSRETEPLVGGEGIMSAPPSARSSPVLSKPKSRGKILQSLPVVHVQYIAEFNLERWGENAFPPPFLPGTKVPPLKHLASIFIAPTPQKNF